MDTLWSLVWSRGRLSQGGLLDFVASKAANDVWQPKSRLICGSWEALDSINRRDLVTAGITGLNCFLVLGPFSASWPCDHKERGSLQERTYCSANTSTMNLPDPQFFSQRNLSIWPVCLDERTKEITRTFRIDWKLVLNWHQSKRVWLIVRTGVRSNQRLHGVGGERGHLTMV